MTKILMLDRLTYINPDQIVKVDIDPVKARITLVGAVIVDCTRGTTSFKSLAHFLETNKHREPV